VTQTSSSDKVIWEWKDDYGFVAYDQETTNILEVAFADGKKVIDLNHGYFGQQGGYTIDFTKNQQIKKKTNFRREIKRTGPAPKKKFPF